MVLGRGFAAEVPSQVAIWPPAEVRPLKITSHTAGAILSQPPGGGGGAGGVGGADSVLVTCVYPYDTAMHATNQGRQSTQESDSWATAHPENALMARVTQPCNCVQGSQKHQRLSPST